MQATGDATAEQAEAKKSSKASKKEGKKSSKEDAPAEAGPSVAAHPRAALHVARVKGWGGLIGFLVGGYLSLPTSTLAAAGLRALVAGVACYLAGWAGSVFVWRHLVMLQYAGARQRLYAPEPAAFPSRSGFGARMGGSSPGGVGGGMGGPSHVGAGAEAGPEVRRENVRVNAQCPVVAYVGAARSRVQTFTIDVSAGGLLVGGLGTLRPGEPIEFQLTLEPGTPAIAGTGAVVRTDPQGRCAIAFKSVSDPDQHRLVQFIFDYQRSHQ